MASPQIADLEGDLIGIRLGREGSGSWKAFSEGDELDKLFEFEGLELGSTESFEGRVVVLRRFETELSAAIKRALLQGIFAIILNSGFYCEIG